MGTNVIPATGLSTVVPHSNPALDIVFVHGFTGHPERTWTYKRSDSRQPEDDNGEASNPPSKARRLLSFSTAHQSQDRARSAVYWPRDLLPATVPNARVLTYGYDTHIRHWIDQPVSRNTVRDIAWDFLIALEAVRREEPRRPLLFIVHSLGGIVVKELLRRSRGCDQGQAHLRNVFESTTGIMFFGTPHGGADPRGILQHAAQLLIKAIGYKVNEQIVNTLLPSSERLRELRDEFGPMAHEQQWTIHSFQEQLGMRALGGRKVVDDPSSYLNLPVIEITEHIGKNHVDMCRFSGPEDVEYKKVDAALRRMTAKLITDRIPSTSSSLAKEYRQKLRDSLAFDQIDARHKTIKRAHARTCKWLTTKDEYLTWLDPSKISEHRGFLWIKGKPGTGKSTLMKFAFGEAQRTMRDRVILSFFFNARGDKLEYSTVGMYRSLLSQLLHGIPGLETIFDSLHLTTWPHGGAIEWGVEELKYLFEEAVRNLGQSWVVCFIDALDECDEDEIRDMVSFFEHIGELSLESNIRFQICFSSRHYPHITMAHGLELILEGQEGHKQDIANYVDSELKIGQSRLATEIRAELQEKASGIFLWIVLVVGILNKEYDRGRVHALRNRLREIPASLHDLFRDILTRDSRGREELILCIQWVLFAKQPLKPEELYFAVLTGMADGSVTPWDREFTTLAVIHLFIVDSSKGLAEITKAKSPRVQFIHESVRDFLLKDNELQGLWPDFGGLFQGRNYERLKECCAKYFCSEQLLMESKKNITDHCVWAQQSFPFLQYAIYGVLYHANEAASERIDQRSFLQQFPLRKWIYTHNLIRKQKTRHHTSDANLLHQAAEDGYLAIAALLVEAHAWKDAENNAGRTPLYLAVWNGHTALARLLIDAGADVEAADKDGWTPLSRAARSGNLVMTKLLLEAGADFEARDKTWRTALSLAAEADRSEITKLLLDAGADTEARDENGRTPLSWAAEKGRSEITTLLLEAGAIKEAVDVLGRTPLLWAAEADRSEIMKLLLEAGADTEARDENGRTPLSWAAAAGNSAVTKLLLEAGADKEAADECGITPLSYAAGMGISETTKLLLEVGADREAASTTGRTPLSRAAGAGNWETTKLLLEAGANKEATDSDGRTPLSWAAGSENAETPKLLLDAGADREAADKDGQTPLSWAAMTGSCTTTKLFLEAGADKEVADKGMGTPLLQAIRAGGCDKTKLLLEAGANKEAADKDGLTALSWAARLGRFETTMLLLEAGADKEAADKNGRTPLLWAVHNWKPQTVKLLLEAGANKEAADKNGRTPLSWAARGWISEAAKLLLEAGADNEAADKDGRTPLSWAAGSGSTEADEAVLGCRGR